MNKGSIELIENIVNGNLNIQNCSYITIKVLILQMAKLLLQQQKEINRLKDKIDISDSFVGLNTPLI